MKETSHSPSFTAKLGKAIGEALEVARLYAELINNKANPLQAVGPIMAAMHCPASIGQDSPATKEELQEAIRAYAEVCADFLPKFKIRNYNFFGMGHYLNYIPRDADVASAGTHGKEAGKSRG